MRVRFIIAVQLAAVSVLAFAGGRLLKDSATPQALFIPIQPDNAQASFRNATYPTADYIYPSDVGYYNVKKYGARGDGVADDTPAIRSAMNAPLLAGRG